MKPKIPTVVGLSSLLTIFGVLCLTVFSLLSFSGAKADERLAHRARQAAIRYYEADCCAEQLLAQLRFGIVPEGIQEENGIYSFVCRMSDTQILQVEVRVDGTKYEIIKWQSVSVTDWQADEKLHIWEGK